MNIDNITLVFGDFFEKWRCIASHSIDLILTDMNYNALTGAGQSWDHALDLDRLEGILSSILSPTGWVITTCDFKLMLLLIEAFQHKLEFSHFHIYKKAGAVMPSNKYFPLPDSEFILVFKQKGVKQSLLPFFPRLALEPKAAYVKRNSSPDVPTRRQKKSPVNSSDSSRWIKTIIEAPPKCNMPKEERTPHPTQKSLRLYDQLLMTYSEGNATICDPFCGSGSSLISAHRLGRKQIYGFEIQQDFYEMAKNRIERYLDQGDLFRPPVFSEKEKVL